MDDDSKNLSSRAQNEGSGSALPLGQRTFKERIKVVGVGGGGNNALDHIIRSGAAGVEFLAVNTDAKCLEKCLSAEKLVIGEKLTGGHGAGAKPEIGEQAANESRDAIRDCFKGCDMVYLAAGMGGGTGTGALPVIASIAKDMGILTVSVVTRPFSFEGRKRTLYASTGIERTKGIVDALIVVPNDRLLNLSERTTTITEAFAMADGVLCQAVQSVTDLVTRPGEINVDFADLKSIMKHSGGAVMGVGAGKGDNRADDALKRAMESPLMESSVTGAKGVILNVTGGPDIGIFEVQAAAMKLQGLIDPDANFKLGLIRDENMGADSSDEIQMVVIATGFNMGSEPSAPAPAAPLKLQKVSPPEGEALFSIDSPMDTPSYLRRRPRK
jgi:cell division protein FtsZ